MKRPAQGGSRSFAEMEQLAAPPPPAPLTPPSATPPSATPDPDPAEEM